MKILKNQENKIRGGEKNQKKSQFLKITSTKFSKDSKNFLLHFTQEEKSKSSKFIQVKVFPIK